MACPRILYQLHPRKKDDAESRPQVQASYIQGRCRPSPLFIPGMRTKTASFVCRESSRSTPPVSTKRIAFLARRIPATAHIILKSPRSTSSGSGFLKGHLFQVWPVGRFFRSGRSTES